ncbi:hypothetical protein A5N15_07590 [Rothia kristinae]|uniref:Uncharacterized protein n=1 Tax=Rothia kristinae TaxID=37923 RepID=A0A657IUG3_9MICC|nr:hypothetical protein A5N15_07590 [Rothia kristinae]
MSLEGTESSQQVAAGRVLSFVFAILFYLAAIVFGMGIAQSILEEKSHRVVEIIAPPYPCARCSSASSRPTSGWPWASWSSTWPPDCWR